MLARIILAGLLVLAPGVAVAQSSAGGGGSGGGAASSVSVTNNPLNVALSSLPAFAQVPTFNLGTLNGAATDASVVAVKNALGSPLQAGGAVSVSNLPATQAVSAASLPLPSGAATSAGQNVTNAGTSASQAQAVQGVTNGVALGISGAVSVSNFPSSQAITGTVGVSSLPALAAGSNAIGSVSVSNFPGTQAVSAASLPLPSGAATAANQASEISAINQRVLTFAPSATAASLAASTATATSERSSGAAAGGTGPWQSYRVFVRSDQAFTVFIYGRTVSNGANIPLATASVAANTPTFLSVPVTYPIYITQVINGSTAATAFSLTDAFSIN